ncbi:hypothetical protein ACQPYE_07745 [Actinosynnema sp. CA-299493]
MSHIAFLNIPGHGHVNPTLPVVTELVNRGHRVTYAVDPGFAGDELDEWPAAEGCAIPPGRTSATRTGRW